MATNNIPSNSQRVNGAVLNPGDALGIGQYSPTLDPRFGGMHGFAPFLDEFVSNAGYVRENIIAILLTAPRAFDYLDNKQLLVDMLKSIVETKAERIEGLNAKLTVTVAENPLGGSNQVQEEFTQVQEERSSITMVFKDTYGGSLGKFWRMFIHTLIADPRSTVPNILSYAPNIPDLLPDMRTFSMMFIEPDPRHKTVIRSWVMSNMAPKDSGDVIGKKDKTTAKDLVEHSISFTGFHQYGLGVDLKAQEILNKLNLYQANPELVKAHIGAPFADVAAAGRGYMETAKILTENQAVIR